MHIFFVVPLFFAVGILQTKTPEWLYYVLLAVGIFGILYHSWKYMSTRNNLNLFHVVAVFPLLIFIGILRNKTPNYAYVLLFAYGVVALWYHGKMLV